jgi:hypothetical protein
MHRFVTGPVDVEAGDAFDGPVTAIGGDGLPPFSAGIPTCCTGTRSSDPNCTGTRSSDPNTSSVDSARRIGSLCPGRLDTFDLALEVANPELEQVDVDLLVWKPFCASSVAPDGAQKTEPVCPFGDWNRYQTDHWLSPLRRDLEAALSSDDNDEVWRLSRALGLQVGGQQRSRCRVLDRQLRVG